MSKADVLRGVIDGYEQWQDLLAEIGEAQMTTPGVAGEWSVKDIVAHVGWYEWWTSEFIRTRNWPEVPEHLNFDDTDARNDAYFLEKRDAPLAEVLADAKRFHEGFVEAISQLAEDDFADQTRLGMPTGEGWELPNLIPDNSNRHYEDHAETIRERLKKQ
jgi:hypothetical protein